VSIRIYPANEASIHAPLIIMETKSEKDIVFKKLN
ncbi:MAG: hypothetical protein PWR03_1457, partial [Tenuifilum sp.]|nr:hypothetical protein [Tenuifilum sp.]